MRPFWLWISKLSIVTVLLAANVLRAEQVENSPEATGLLWLSPANTDLDEHVNQSTAAAATVTDLETGSGIIPKTADTDQQTRATSETKPTQDDVEEVFGDVLLVITPAATDTTARPAAKPAGELSTASRQQASESATVASTDTQPPARVIPARVANLRKPIEDCLRLYEPQNLNSGEHSCWSMMHSFLGWGLDSQIRIGSSNGRSTGVLNWLCQNQPCAGRRLFYVSDGRIKAREGAGYQGHPAQFLAMAAQTDTPPEQRIRVEGEDFSIDELVKEEQLTCREPMELTFKLIGLSHYLDTDVRWRNDRGETWDLARIIRAELAQPINSAACGGTHRIMGLNYAVNKRKAAGKSIEGQWWRAEKYINDYYAYSLSLQNRDGSFSSDWFKRRSDWGGQDRKLQTTGHILEWMVYASSEEQLMDERICRSVAYLTNLMVQHRYHNWEYGPKGHAVRALRLYHERVFGGEWQQPATLVRRAQQPAATSRKIRHR